MSEQRRLTYFVSDLHLGASYFMDPKVHERKVCEWLRSIKTDARRLILVGDILDYWFEYRYVVPRGFVRFFGTLAELADSGVDIIWMIGNHDIWIFDYLPTEIGIKVVDGILDTKIAGRRFIISHGDGLGRIPWRERLMRSVFRNKFCQWLYKGVHPRWTVGFAYSWSAANRRKHHTGPTAKPLPVGPLEQWVREQQALCPQPPVDFYVFGHYHTLVNREVDGARMIVLGDWITNMSYGVFDGTNFTLSRAYESENIKI